MPFVRVIKVDITDLHSQAIVNAAKNAMRGGGVDGAVHSKGGPEVRADCIARNVYLC